MRTSCPISRSWSISQRSEADALEYGNIIILPYEQDHEIQRRYRQLWLEGCCGRGLRCDARRRLQHRPASERTRGGKRNCGVKQVNTGGVVRMQDNVMVDQRSHATTWTCKVSCVKDSQEGTRPSVLRVAEVLITRHVSKRMGTSAWMMIIWTVVRGMRETYLMQCDLRCAY
jgi:hypothetical protein